MASTEGPEAAGAPPAHELPSRSILVLYGSETGNSQEIAEDLDRISQRLRFESRVAEMNSAQLVCQPPLPSSPRPSYISPWKRVLTLAMSEHASAVLTGGIRHLDHGPGRCPSQRRGAMEEAFAEEITPRVSQHNEVHELWPWGHIVSSVRTSAQISLGLFN